MRVSGLTMQNHTYAIIYDIISKWRLVDLWRIQMLSFYIEQLTSLVIVVVVLHCVSMKVHVRSISR